MQTNKRLQTIHYAFSLFKPVIMRLLQLTATLANRAQSPTPQTAKQLSPFSDCSGPACKTLRSVTSRSWREHFHKVMEEERNGRNVGCTGWVRSRVITRFEFREYFASTTLRGTSTRAKRPTLNLTEDDTALATGPRDYFWVLILIALKRVSPQNSTRT